MSSATPAPFNLRYNADTGTLQYEFQTGWIDVPAGAVEEAAGSNTQIQYNNNGVLGASSSLTFSGTTLTVGSATLASALLTVAGAKVATITGSATNNVIKPLVDHQNAWDFTQADGTTSILSIDTNNRRIGIGTSTPSKAFDVNADALIEGTLTVQSGIRNTLAFTAAGTGALSIDAAAGQNLQTITIGTATTITTITNGYDGQKLLLRLVQDNSGHTVSFTTGGANNVEFGTTITSFTASGANLIDYVGLVFNSARSRWDLVSVSQGF